VTLDGKPAGTAQIHAWRSGTFAVVLMPLFPEPSMRIPVVDLSEPMARIDEPEPTPLPPAPHFLPRKAAPQPAAQPSPRPAPRPASQPALQPVHPVNVPMTTAPSSGEFLDDDVLLPSLKKNRGLRAVVVGALVIGAAGLLLVVTSSKPTTKAPPAAAAAAIEPDKKGEPEKKAEPDKKAEPEKKPEPPKGPSDADKAEATKLAQKAQGLVDLNKRKQAMPLLAQAQKLDPTNELAKTVVAQARGEAGEGMLVVASLPKPAKVVIDGTPMGKTPLKLKKFPAGAHTVQVAEQVQEFEVQKGKKKTVVFKLGGKKKSS